jgi:uncharacterized protein YraI
MRKFLALILFLTLLTGCASPATPTATATLTPLPFFTATLKPTATPRPSLTPAPPTVVPTIAPLGGVLTTQVNVRSAADANANSLGVLNVGVQVKAIGKDANGQWLMIIYPENSSTTAWVVASYVQLESGVLDKLPVMQSALPLVPDSAASQPEGTPLPPPSPTANLYAATIKNTINVRSGPASAFEALGTISAGTQVILTGRDQINTWYQIEFPGGPDGRGWVAAAYVEAANLQGLPYYDNQGQLIFAPAAGANPGQPTLTVTSFAPANGDGDSEQKPAVNLESSPTGAQKLTYSSDLSAPNGDDADWVAFIPYVPTSEAGFVYLRLDCTGNGGVTATLEKDSHPVEGAPQLVCGNYGLAMKVLGGQPYMLVLRADGSGGPLRYVSYTVTISTIP